jgi:hypothetical protein
MADAGVLAGHIDAVCGTRKLAARAVVRAAEDETGAAQRFVTDCDVAADPLQSRQPTLSTRFTPAERDAVIAGFSAVLAAGRQVPRVNA